MNSFIDSLKSKKIYILHFTFYIIITPLLIVMLSCSPTTEIKKGELSGVVNLEGMQDHSGIVVELYELAYLDTTITRINQEYPHIGVIITQHTEFDHRLQSSVKTTTTEADGSFELTKIPTGTYNLIAMKAGFGFKYLYEITIAEGENELTPRSPLFNAIEGKIKKNKRDVPLEKGEQKGVYYSRNDSGELNRLSEELSQRHSTKSLSPLDAEITLYEEIHISGNISDDITVASDHHLVIDDDTVFLPNTSSLTIAPGAIIRINPGKDLTIHGILTAQGEEDNMFWITSNHGFDVRGEEKSNEGVILSGVEGSPFTFPISRNSIELYNSMELSSIASVSDDLISWGKWDWGIIALKSNANITITYNSCFKNNIISYQNNECEDVGIINSNFSDNSSENKGCIDISFVNIVNIENNIITRSMNGVKLMECDIAIIENCYMVHNISKGIINFSNSNSTISNCEIYESTYGILNTGSTLKVYYSKFQNRNCISDQYTYGINGESFLELQNNNFSAEVYAVRCTSWFHDGIEHVFDSTNNYWGTIDELGIQELIWDRNDAEPEDPHYDEMLGVIDYTPFKINPIQNAGIQ